MQMRGHPVMLGIRTAAAQRTWVEEKKRKKRREKINVEEFVLHAAAGGFGFHCVPRPCHIASVETQGSGMRRGLVLLYPRAVANNANCDDTQEFGEDFMPENHEEKPHWFLTRAILH